MTNITDSENRSNGAYANNYVDTELYLEILIGPEWSTTQLYVQTFDDNASRKLPSLAGVLPGCWEKLKPTLIELNQRGAGIYLTVNETGGGRKGEDFLSARAIWCDWDTPEKTIPDWPLLPHLTIQTSPGKFHFYWLVTGLSGEDHRRIMLTMTEQWGNDSNAKDLTRVLRIPGFYHRKGEPFLVQLCKFEDRSALPPYTREEVISAFQVPPVRETWRRTYGNTTDGEWKKVIDALRYLDPSMPRHEWLDIGFCLSSTGDPRAFDAWNDWSKGSTKKYQPEIMRKTWESMREQKGEVAYQGLTIGTLFYRADIERKRQEAENNKPLFHLTETGLAERIASQHQDTITWCETWKKWLVFDGRQWKVDALRELQRFAKDAVKALYREAYEAEDEERQKIAKFALRSESEKVQRAALELTKSERDIPVLPSIFDTNPWLLNCRNGTLDLRTGTLKAHDPQDYLTKLIPINYDAAAECPIWESFLAAVMNSAADEIEFLKRAIGYSLTGDVREDCYFILYGEGANGKSTFLNTLLALLGNYGKQTPFETFLYQDRTRLKPELADLAGTRFVTASEVDEGKQFSMSTVKTLTGKDPISARHLYSEHFEYYPQLKIWLGVNHKPVITDTSYAAWRRPRLIPFTQTFTEKVRDPLMGEKLQSELPGILTWAVQGCLEWQREGLPITDTIKSATAEYRAESDVIGNFLSECCVQELSFTVLIASLYDVYVDWCKKSGTGEPKTKIMFGKELEKRGFRKDDRTGKGRKWTGLKLDMNT